MTDGADVIVVGAGFGGLGAALSLAERGARVVVCERLDYPGGCAGTFEKKGARYDAGATLSAGLGPGQLFSTWLARHRIALDVEPLDPVVHLVAPGLSLDVPADRARFVEHMVELAGADGPRVRRFFALQREVADTLWRVLDEPELLPPFGLAALGKHAARSPRYLGVARWMGSTLLDVLRAMGVSHVAPLRLFCDAVCQITVQCDAATAEAPFALSTLDYFFRGAAHVRGGIGRLADALVAALEGMGGRVQWLTPVRAIAAEREGYRVETRRGPLHARAVVANVLPQALRALLGAKEGELPRLDRLAERTETGWSAAMLYLLARAPAGAPRGACHLELIDDASRPLTHGNHVFLSISGEGEPGRAPPGLRAITASTHVPASELRGLDPDGAGARMAEIQSAMRRTIAARAPDWWAGVTREMTASPRTFERYTQRPGGLVGGVPRRRGLDNYTDCFPRAVRPGLWLVGDTVFPGQSTLATAIGGTRAAAALARELALPARAASRPATNDLGNDLSGA